MKVAGKTRKQEILDFFVEHHLFMPSSIAAREAIHFFVHSGNGYELGGATSEERIALLRKATEELRGKRMQNKKAGSRQVILEVCYVLPKTKNEIRQQIVDRANDRKGVLEKHGISPLKVCVVSPSLSKPCVIPLDMLVLVSDEAAQ